MRLGISLTLKRCVDKTSILDKAKKDGASLSFPSGDRIGKIKIRFTDNHSAHVSKETRRYLATRPNQFEFIHTPTHESWLNIVETLFGKMARTFLKFLTVLFSSMLMECLRKSRKVVITFQRL